MSDQVLIAIIGIVVPTLTVIGGFWHQSRSLKRNTELTTEARNEARGAAETVVNTTARQDETLGVIKEQTNGRVTALITKVDMQGEAIKRIDQKIDLFLGVKAVVKPTRRRK